MSKPKLAATRPFLTVLALGLVSLVLSPVALATDLTLQGGVNSAQGTGVPTQLFGGGGAISSVVNILLFLAGALSVVMIIIGGLRYVLSGGNATAVTAAKNTILYAIVGLVVAFLAYAAINFVLGYLSSSGLSSGPNL